ncbi:hypothetical protein LCGC14_3111860 [marine sediment metagenome]|uniref:Uncharacterized protein n=1 Tax=marine sediment metagenome TaxID=412755 RepID=A0A0F8W4U9_9ZZZZ
MGVGIWPNGIICDAGDAQIIDLVNAAKADATVVANETYRIFAPMVGIVALGYSTPATIGNVIGVIPPGGFVDIRIASGNTTLSLVCLDTTDDYGTDFDAKAYVVKLSNNA